MRDNIFKSIISSTKSRDFRIFLLFMILSFLIWHFEKLRQTYSVNVPLNITSSNVPSGYIILPEMQNKVNVVIEGDGLSIMYMYLMHKQNINVDISPLRLYSEENQTWAIFIPHRLTTQNTDMPEHIKITEVLTDTVMIPLLTVKQRKVPVQVRENLALKPQYLFSAPRMVVPDSVTITATNNIMDTLKAVYTAAYPHMEIDDTTRLTLPLVLPKHASADHTDVVATYFVESFTEKKISVPITSSNVPNGYKIKTFPSNAQVTFSVGLSMFEKTDAKSFEVVADFASIKPGDKESRLRLRLKNAPAYVQNISVSPTFAGFLLEKED